MQTIIQSNIARLASLLILTGSLMACGGGSDGTTQAGAAASDAAVSESTPPTSAPPSSEEPSVANHVPTITGSAITSVSASKAYSFTPSATDVDGDRLQFAITSKPSWASFDASTGRLSGTPTNANVGSYEEIQISVTDGEATTKLAQFAITVEAAAATTRNVLLSWLPPTTNSDGSALTNLNGYRIMYGTQSGQYTQTVSVNGAGLTSYQIENLESGKQYHVVMVAVTSTGAESQLSAEVVLSAT
jgi:hypothetical protein